MANQSLPKNILIVKNRALGDAIITLGSIAYLKGALANPKITYLVPDWIFPLFRFTRVGADDVLPLKLRGLSDFFSLFFKLLSRRYDLIIECHQRGRTANFFSFFCFLTRTKYYFHNHNKTKRAPAIERDLQICYEVVKKYFPQASFPSFLDFEPRIQVLETSERKKQIVFGMVATRSTKMWPLKYFKYLADMLLKNDDQLEILMPLSTSSQDEAIEKEWQSLNPSPRVKIVKVGLGELPAKLVSAQLYIGNDTGIKHLCVALGMPTYTFFGPEEPFEWHPYHFNKHKYFFIENLACRTSKSHYCGLAKCDSMICLNQFIPPKIVEELEKNKLL